MYRFDKKSAEKSFVFFSLSNPLIKISSKRSYLYIIHLIARLSLHSKLSKIFILLNFILGCRVVKRLMIFLENAAPYHLFVPQSFDWIEFRRANRRNDRK